MAFKTTVKIDQHVRRLREIHDTVEDEAVIALLEHGELVRQEAMQSIRDGTIRGPGHVAAPPGMPPNGDTGELELGILVELRRSDKTVNVVSTAPHAAAQEFGTVRAAARPYMRPASQKFRSRLVTVMARVASGRQNVRVFKNSTASIDAASEITGR